MALPRLRATGTGLPPGCDQRLPQGRAIRSARQEPRRRDREESTRDRRRLFEPLPPVGPTHSGARGTGGGLRFGLLPYLIHVEPARRLEYLVECAGWKRSGFSEDDEVIAEDHQRGDRTDAEVRSNRLLF